MPRGMPIAIWSKLRIETGGWHRDIPAMWCHLVLLFGLLPILSSPAWAGYAEGITAYGRADYEIAAREFRPAAEAGDAESAYMLGRLYALGAGVPQDWVQAWIWYDIAARQGHAAARGGLDMLETILNPAQLAEAHRLSSPPPPSPADTPRRQLVIIPRPGPQQAEMP